MKGAASSRLLWCWRLLLFADIWLWAEAFVNSPKIISKDGNLIFESGANRNISFRLTGTSRLTINEEYDVLELLLATGGGAKKRSGGAKDEWSSSEDIVDVRELADQLADFQRRAFGANGLNVMLRQQQNRTRGSLALMRRFQTRLRAVESKVDRMKTQLEANSCASGPCENGGTCFNTYSGFRCQCRPAFEGPKCEVDVNECALYEGTDLGCQNGAQCQNQFGTYTCLCQQGWHGMHCTQRRADCSQASAWELCGHGSCVPSSDDAGYRCLCDAGWKTNGVTPVCGVDVDECNEATAAHTPCSTKCINLPGSFTCAPCPAGLTGNGVSCRDVDECQTNNGGCSLSPRVDCINTYGSHICGQCPVGWAGEGLKCERVARPGMDSDGSETKVASMGSCAERSSLCHPAASCYEISGTAVCNCPANMVGSGIGPNGCVNGTARNCRSNPCLNNGICLDSGPSNFTCLCSRGFRPPICEPLPSPCDLNPCKNGGSCRPTTSGSDGFVCQCLPGYRDRLCSTRFSSCNALLVAASGRLKYPPEGTGYEHNAQCAWVIRTNESLVLNVTFHSFDLEDSTECRFDWLQVNDGRSAAAQIIGRYCGSHLPHGGHIVSSGNQLYLWFRSDNSTAKEGFDLTWSSMQPQCGGRLEFETHGTLASPGSPGNYPKNRDCRWTLVAPINKRIKLTFFSLQLERHRSCNFDYVEIKDSISDRELAKYCSSGQPAPLLLPTHQAEILFHSDADGSDTGFQLHYSVEERIPGCGGIYTAREGTISGASGPGVEAGSESESQAGDPVSCEYEIRFALGELIAIQFDKLELGPQDCLEILDATDENVSTLQAKICGSDAARSDRPAYTSLFNRLKIKFYASAGQFQLHYQAACFFTLDSAAGTVMSPGYPNMTSGDRSCTYTIRTAPNTVISVRRMDFQLRSGEKEEDDAGCLTTNLRINDGLNRQILGPYCGDREPPEVFLSHTNHLQYLLTTDTDTQGRGFKFEYQSVPAGGDKCGGVHTRLGDNIRLPVNGAGEYATDATCYWVIMAPPNKAIRLHWLSFDLEGSNDCSFDYVEIYDRLDAQNGSTGMPLAKYCDNRLPEDLLSHSRQLVIKFSSDYSESEGGFELSYTFEDVSRCGGHIHASAGELSSPRYPMNYSNDLDCDWRLTGALDHLLEIQLEIFDLEQSPNCSADYLEVMNGGGNDSPLIGRFCGTSIPTRMPSFSHELRLRLHTDSANTGRGFRLRWRMFASGCGGRLRANAGVITSPRYPNNYPHMAHCEWHLTVHQGSGIALLIEDMELETLSNCYYDNVKLYSGPWLPGQKPDRTLCRPLAAGENLIQLDSNEATIVFDTDSSTASRGFRISFKANCVRNLTATSGTIESLNYQEPFMEDMPINCSWTIRAPKGNSIRLEVSHLQSHEEHLPTALPGGLFVVDGAHTQKLDSPKALNASGGLITVVHNASSLGFLLDYRVVGCLEELRGESGSFRSPNYPGMYPNNMECYWLIHVERDNTIELTITQLDLEESVNCTKDALTVSNHISEVQIHERHCGSTAKLVLTSAGPKLHVRFISDGSHNGKGFLASYRAVKATCGGKISSRNGVIQSPGYPFEYPERSHCEWQVEVSPYHRIVFDVQDMELESGYSCSWDYLEAFDLAEDDTEGRQLFKLCSDNEADEDYRQPRLSSTNVALVRFVSDDSNSKRGFQLNFHESCGQTVSIDDTDFEYLQLGRQAARDERCLWVLQAQEAGKHIIFTATHIKLREGASSRYPTEGECMPEGVKIYEGTEPKGTPRLQFCMSHPPALISNGQALTISVPLQLVEEFEGHYMTMDTSCGSLYTAISGRFTTPYYPGSYPVNIECIWMLEANEGNSLSLTLESMDLEDSDGCNRDYVEVREESERGALIGVYCGNQLPGAIHSRGSIWMKFKSDDDNVGEGFMASYNYEHHNELTGADGIVESPHYPSKFQDPQHPYSWRITVDKDYVVVVLVSHLRDLDQPHLRFYDGYSDIGARIEITDPDEPIRSSSNVLYFTASRGPFRLSWQRLSKEELLSNRSAEEQTRLCGNQLVAVNQSAISFHSPGYPNGYENGLKCSWSLVASDPAMHTVLQLSKVDLEVFGGDNECIADYLRISSGNDLQRWWEPRKLCSLNESMAGQAFHGKPYLRVEFITDTSINQTGFTGMLRTACGSEITASKGEINITDVVRRSAMRTPECVWTLKVRQGRRIRIDFPQSQLQNGVAGISGSGSGCDTFLVLRNGHDEDSPFLGHGKYCEDNIQDSLETTSNRAYVKFRYQGPPRFQVTLRFEELSHACSRRIELLSGTDEERISSPYYPNLPHPHSECVWIVTAPPQHRIRLHFEGKFDLTAASPDSGECQREYVVVNDGSTELRPELGRYCGQRSPDTIYSAGSQLRIRYYTDVTEPHMGFQASLKLARCGGTYHSPEGVIASPPRELLQLHSDEGSSGSRQQLEECVYTIELEKGSTIDLLSDWLQLPQPVEGNCSQHTHLLLEELEPFGSAEGEERISDRLMICGSDARHLLGETNKIVFRYRLLDGLPAEGQGFRIRYTSVGSRCGETITAMQGILQTPGYPEGVRTPTHCIWKLEVPKGRRVRLEIVDFNTGGSNASSWSTFRGRLTIANDHKMQSILGRYANNPPESVLSSDNTMGIDAFLLPIGRHRGFKFRFQAYGSSLCERLDIERNVAKEMAFERSSLTSLVHCSYDIQPPVNSTVLLEVKAYNTSSVMMRNSHLCSLLSPLKLNREDQSEALLPRLLCDFEASPQLPAIRVPFPIQLMVSASVRNALTSLVLGYSLQACGGVFVLEPGDNMTVRQDSGLADIQGAIDCAWAIGPYYDATAEDESAPQDIQLEVSLRVNLPTTQLGLVRCQHHFLRVYNGPDQNSPQLGQYCQEDVAVNMVVERGLFLEYHADQFSPNATFNVSIKYGSGCGGRLKHPYRAIEFYEQYKNNVECIWEVEAEAGYHIGLSFFNRFYIEDSPGCAKDYLLVQQRQDANGNWTDLRRICGRSPPDRINTTARYMKLIFRSDGDIVGDGFFAKFERNCGGPLYADDEEQTLSSPNFPLGYDKNLYCNWTLVPRNAEAGRGVLVSFDVFDLEYAPIAACLFDNLTVITRDDKERVNEAVICGVKQNHEYRARESINLILRTDSSFSGKGFLLRYSTRLCGGVVNQTGVVESPRQHTDNSLPPSSDCYWNLTAPAGHKFTVKFELLDFEAHSLCAYDGVEIFAGAVPIERERRGRFCGRINENLPVISIPQNRGLIHSYSDDRDPSRGFRALVRIVPNCDEQILVNGSSRYIFSKFSNANGYEHNLDCQLVFRVHRDQQLSLEFRSFHVELSEGCRKDYVELRDGAGPFADLMGRFCGQDQPPALTTTRHTLFLRFVTDERVNDSGFELALSAVPRVCGSPDIKLASDGVKQITLGSPSRVPGGNYANGVACFWKIEGDKPLSMHFLSFDLEGPDANGSCVADYLKVYNSEDAQLVEHGFGSELIFNGHTSGRNYVNYATEHVYCGQSKPDTYYANANAMFLKFRSNAEANRPGFQLQIALSDFCERHYDGLQGRVRLSETADCDIMIQAPANHTLSLYYSELIFGSSDCDVEHLEVFDRSNHSVQRICSYVDAGKSLFSSADQLRLHVKTGSYLSTLDLTYLASPVEKGPGCGGQFYNTEGIFANPFYPANVRNNSDCRWLVRVPSNNRVLLTFETFNLGSKSTCHTDYLQILEQDDSGVDREVRRFCGEDSPKVYKSQRSQVVVRFHKTVNYDGVGWVIRFAGVYSDYQIPRYLLGN